MHYTKSMHEVVIPPLKFHEITEINEIKNPLLVAKRGFLVCSHYIRSMHEVVVNVVAIAVRTVIRMFRILFQSVLFSMLLIDDF